MKLIFSLLLALLGQLVAAQTVNISGRCYYDVNGNYVFDGTDSVLAGRTVIFESDAALYSAVTDGTGQYVVSLPVDTFLTNMLGPIDYRNYKDTAYQRRIYTVPGADVVNFAYQKRDSIEQVNAAFGFVAPVLPPSGGTRQYKLTYSYDGLLPAIPASITLRYSSKLTLVNSSFPPSVTSSGFLQWNFASVQRNVYGERPQDSILLTFSFPAVGDTIGSFVLEPKFIPVINVTKPYRKYNYNYEQGVLHDEALPAGPTNGIKWLRQYPFVEGGEAYDFCNSVDTALNGTGYFVSGQRSVEQNSEPARRFSYIARLNPDGLSVWEKYIDTLPGGSDLLENVNAVKHTSDGGCMVLGTSRGINYLGSYDAVLLKLNTVGDIVWSKKLEGSGYEGVSNNLLVLPDGSSVIAGNTDSKDGDFANNTDTLYSNLFITKFAANGNKLFTKIYGGSKGEYANRLISLQNGSFLLLAVTASNDGDVTGAHQHFTIAPNGQDTVWAEEAWVLNINASGGMIWNRCYGGRKDSYFSGATENSGGILLTGYTNSKDGDLPYYQEMAVPLWVLQISNTGNIQWSKLHKLYRGYQDTNYVLPPYEAYYNSAATSLCKTKDGNFVIGSITGDKYGTIKATHGYEDMVIVKLNTTGDIVWQKAIGGTQSDYVNEIQVDRNDDIIFGGSSNSSNDDLYQQYNNINFYEEAMVVGKQGITNAIKGQVFVDNNGNHIKDAGEMYYSQGRVNSVKNTDTVVARIFDGRFFSNVDTGTYVTTYKPVNNYYTVFPASRNSSFATFDVKDSFDFALTPKPNINDLEVQLLPLSTPRPGFDVTYRVITKNVGTTTLTNVVVGFKHDSRMMYNYGSRPEDGNVADSVWWGPFTLNAFDIDTLYINYTLDAPPLLNNGDTITNMVTANPVINDSSTANNIAIVREQVRGSFDPNDKTETHGGTLTTTQYAGGEYLQYLIRFQNTGTDTAFFVTIKDTLQNKLDLATLEILSASHPFVFRLNGNVATWDFKKIYLPDSTTDEPGSHGFILFKVKPKTGLAVGDEFINHAAIYFDFNLPVITNQDKTTIGSNNGVCPNGNVSYTAGLTGTTYQWQVNTGSGYVHLSNGGIYSGVNTAVLTLTGVPTSMYGYRYRCIVNGGTISPENTLRFAVQWTGAAGTAWENAANWDCNTLPDAKTEVIIPAGVNYPQVNSNRACYSLRLSPGSSVVVKTGFTLTITGTAN
jgi:hypothetical protein